MPSGSVVATGKLAMALLTALLTFVGRQLNTVVQAILGWSVTALFGRLPSIKQTALRWHCFVSLLWPLVVLGIVFPAVTAWAFTMLPVHKWLGPGVVRSVTVGLALALPLAVGGITRWVSPAAKKQGLWRALLGGYPLTTGYAAACIVTAVTVPLIKIGSAIRGWYDDHVFVQPRGGEYAETLNELVRACEVAKVRVRGRNGSRLHEVRLHGAQDPGTRLSRCHRDTRTKDAARRRPRSLSLPR